MRDVLLIVDVLDDFRHEQGDELLSSFERRHEALVQLLDRARFAELPIVFANDNQGIWDSDVTRLVQRAKDGLGGELVCEVAPRPGERFVTKPRYSAFDHTPLKLIMDDLECERLMIGGMSTEGCVTQSAIAARELGLKVTAIPSACATVDPGLEETALRYLADVAGVELADVAEVFSAWEQRDS